MRLLLSILFLSVFLSIGGNVVYASTSSINKAFSQKFSQKKQLNSPNEIQVYTLIDDNELDSEEENHICKKSKNQNPNTVLLPNAYFLSQKYCENYRMFFINNSLKRFKNQPPFYGYVIPDYFTQSILRI
jgi:hypothetical protein